MVNFVWKLIVVMNFIERLCGKGEDAQVYKDKPFLAFGNLQQAVPVYPKAKRWLLGCMYVDCACKNRCLFNPVRGWTRGGRFRSAFRRYPLANFCVTLN